MQVVFKSLWFAPAGFGRYRADSLPQEVPDHLVEDLPSTAVVVGPEEAVEEWKALRDYNEDDEEQKDILDAPVRVIVEKLEGMELEELEDLLERERDGKTRSSLVKALKSAIAELEDDEDEE